jgi:methionyl-tRNA synthetase
VPCWLGSIGSRRSCCSSHTTCTGHTRSRHLARTASTATPAVMARGHGQPPPPPLLQRWPPGSKPVYITTPLFYVNGRPHVGHLYSALVGDALARWYRLRHASTFLLVGTDEHGLKVQQAAAAAQGGAGISVAEYASHQSAAFRALFDEAGIGYDRFLRTSEPEHAAAVRRLWRTLAASGSIKHGSHAGWYCVADETFVPESQVVLAGEQQEKGGSSSGGNGGCSGGGQRVSAESGRPVEWASEDNYLFKLGSKRAALREWLYTAPAASAGTKVEEAAAAATAGQWSWSARVTPPGAAAWVESALRGGDDDDDDDDGCSAGADAQELSVSRPVERVSWGIEVPDDPSHTVYVWMDALCNYLTAAGYAEVDDPASMPLWPPDHQVLGKDILKFHAVYWPSFLAGREP